MIKCLLCDSIAEEFYKVEGVPCNDGVICDTLDESKSVECDSIVLAYCPKCSFVFNCNFHERKIDYNKKYNNNQVISETFSSYINESINYINNRYHLQGRKIVEIGCGQGEYLKRIADKTNCECFGFDPTYKSDNNLLENNQKIKFYDSFFELNKEIDACDTVIMRHVLEHITDPAAITKVIYNLIKNKKNNLFACEVPDFLWILENKSYFDIIYQHCNFFTKSSLSYLLKQVGFNNLHCYTVFGKQYLMSFAEVSKSVSCEIKTNRDISDLVEHFHYNFEEFRNRWHEAIKEKNKKFAIWGALGKGVNFINIIDRNNEYIKYAIDINKQLHGKYIPASIVPIISPKDIKRFGITDIIIMNPNYIDEIKKLVSVLGIKINYHIT